MSTENKTYTADDIHYFTCSEGRKWAHMPWGMLTGEIPDGVVYPDANPSEDWQDGDPSMESRPIETWTYPNLGKEACDDGAVSFAIVPSDRIEVVTEHVEATVMDAIDALKASGGKPVEGWHFNDGRGSTRYPDGGLAGLRLNGAYPFISSDFREWKHTYRPVTRVRIKAEAVVKEFLAAETVEQAFGKYWQGGSEHRAIDAFRAGAAWAKGGAR